MRDYTIETRDGREVLVYQNGLVKDKVSGKIIAPSNRRIMTSEEGAERRLKGVIKKREIVAKAANREVQDKTLYETFGALAWLAEGAINMQRLATTPEAGKASVDAFAALVKNAGLEEPKQSVNDGRVVTQNNLYVLDADAAEAIRRALGEMVDENEIIEAENFDKE